MFIPTRLFGSNLVPAKPRRAVSRSLGTISVILVAIAFAYLVKQASAAGAWCTAPYINVAGQGTAPPGGDMTGELQIQSINIGEPFDGNCSENSLTVALKVKSMDPGGAGMVTPAYNTEWQAEFVVPGTVTSDHLSHTVFVSWDTETLPTGGFNYGFLDTSSTPNFYYSQCSPTGACPATGTVSPDGTFTIKLNLTTPISFANNTATVFTMGGLPPGTLLTSIAGHIWTCACAAGNGLLVTQSTSSGSTYTVEGNTSCSAPPIAALSAVPTMGNAPLMVNFDASGSHIASGGCGSINSYIFDFGDASGATQPTPTVSHTYTMGGTTYPARVRVTSTAGLTSVNNAEQDIMVHSAGPPPLSSVVSRMTHGAAGNFDIVLPQPPATRNVECRSGGASSNYQLILTFVNTLVSVPSASVTLGAGSVSSSNIDPTNAHNYIVNLTGVTSGQSTIVTLANALDSAGNAGNVPVIIGVLVGDTNNDAFVNSADISQTKSQSGQSVSASNFREDVTVDGFLNSADISLVKSKSGTALP